MRVSDFLRNSKFTPKDVRELVKNRIDDREEAFLLVDDSVQNKQYSRVIETVKLQYSGNVHGLVKGIGLVNLVHTNGFEGDFYPVNYRVYDPESDGKTKNDHFREMFLQAHLNHQIKARSQRNHLACCYSAWVAIKVKAQEMKKTVYQLRNGLFADYLKSQLKNPTIPAL